MTKRKMLITGGSGLLGSNIAKLLTGNFEIYATYSSRPTSISGCHFIQLNVTDEKSVSSALRDLRPDIVIHAAALANVDYCENQPELAWEVNVNGTENVAKAAKGVGAYLVYVSTDSVFDGKKGMYNEQDTPSPINVYARTKLAGEKRVQQSIPESIIVRTAFYGWGHHNRTSLAEWVVCSLNEGKYINMFTDVFFSPLFIEDLVHTVIKMYDRNLTGVYHTGSRERCSKYAFGIEIADTFGLDKGYISPSSIESADLKAPRPGDLSLNVTKLSQDLGIEMPGIKEGIILFQKRWMKVKT